MSVGGCSEEGEKKKERRRNNKKKQNQCFCLFLFFPGQSRRSFAFGRGQVQKNESIVECHHGDASVTQDRNARCQHESNEGLLRRVGRVAGVRHESRIVIPPGNQGKTCR